MVKFARALTLVVLLVPLGVALADDSHSLIVYTVFFEPGSSLLSADDVKVLRAVSELLQGDTTYQMRVVAYTDPVDEHKDDEALAKARAKAVREFMVSKGIDKDRIDVKGKGDEAGFGRDDSATDRALRRRAEILVRQEDRAKRSIDAGLQKGTDTALQTTVFFDFDKAEIKPEFNGVLKRLGEMLAGNPAYQARVFGHTDGVGKADYNLALGNRRSDAVIRELKKAGVSDERLQRESLGQQETIGSQAMEATTTRALSRSVEITVMKVDSESRHRDRKK
jgi:outer membrane protein OmpA-like peptidoglycan-associated protein